MLIFQKGNNPESTGKAGLNTIKMSIVLQSVESFIKWQLTFEVKAIRKRKKQVKKPKPAVSNQSCEFVHSQLPTPGMTK